MGIVDFYKRDRRYLLYYTLSLSTSEGLRQSFVVGTDRFNTRLGFNYDWIFLNDEPFSEEFKKHTKDLVSGEAKYGLIRKEEWGGGFPQGINATLAQEKIDAVSHTHTFRIRSKGGN